MRKPRRAVELDDIISSQIIGDDPEIVALVLKTHLALEALLIEMIRMSRADDKLYRLSFPDKSKWLVDNGMIGAHDKVAFERFPQRHRAYLWTYDHARRRFEACSRS